MNVYDFDKTLYKHDSSVKFYLFCLSKNILLLLYMPYQLLGVLLFIIGIIDKTKMKKFLYSYFRGIKDIDALTKAFWDRNIDQIYSYYKHSNDDIVISASPYFLIREACKRMEIVNVIGSKVDKKTGRPLSHNNDGKYKVYNFINAGFKLEDIDEFYSDSYHDKYLANCSKKAYIVSRKGLEEWKKTK